MNIFRLLDQVRESRKNWGVVQAFNRMNAYDDLVSVYACGSVFKVKMNYHGVSIPGGGLRSRIRGFSSESRKRLLEKLGTLNFTAMMGDLVKRNGWRELMCKRPAVFITLTYHNVWEVVTGHEIKRHLGLFVKRMLYRFPSACGVWRLEYQRRGAPHYHLMVMDLPFWDKDEVRNIWSQIVGERARTEIKAVVSARQCMYYLAKYMGKVDLPGAPRRSAPPSGAPPDGSLVNIAYLAKQETPSKVLRLYEVQELKKGAWVKTYYKIPVRPVVAAQCDEVKREPEDVPPCFYKNFEDLENGADGEKHEDEGWCGRFWGFFGRERLVWCQPHLVKVPLGKWLDKLRRYARRKYSRIGKRTGGFTLFTSDLRNWMRLTDMVFLSG